MKAQKLQKKWFKDLIYIFPGFLEFCFLIIINYMDLTKESEGTFENYITKKDISSISSNVDSTDII